MKILVVEDSPAIVDLLRGHLTNWGYEVDVVGDGLEALKLIQGDEPPPLAIVDWMIPGIDGVALCRYIRRRLTPPYIYVIMLTARDGQEDLLLAMEAGADDYITKPFNAKQLEMRLRAARRIVDFQTEMLVTQEQLRQQANHDPLTGMLNRRAVMDLLTHDCERAARELTALSVFMVDIDNFKDVNDTFGHAAGDSVLCEVARRITKVLRPYDAGARIGGEEFLIVLPGCPAAGAYSAAERLRYAVASAGIVLPSGEPLMVTCSIGVAALEKNIVLPGVLVEVADAALYEAKQSGRNKVVLSTRFSAP